MSKIVAAFNMTIDGVFDHTAGLPDAQIHRHYKELLEQGAAILYGRKTFLLMKYWQTLPENPSREESNNEFAAAINRIPKIVFSHTLKKVDWESATLAKAGLMEEVLSLRQLPGKDIIVGSRSLITQLLTQGLIDELQLCIYPVIEGKGRPLFEHMNQRIIFNLVKAKTFKSGATILYYKPVYDT